jgi:membrane-associated phospholipid phosphatase
MVVCIVALSATGRNDRLRLMVAAAVSSGIVTILISGAVPAMGNVFDPAGYHSLWPSVAWLEHDLITGLRDGSVRKLDLTQLMGIVTFPSYHATLPIILAWAQRDVARLRIIAPVWAVVTILATPVFGGHYGVDVLAGIGLAVGGIAVAPALTRRRSTTP